MSVAKKKKFDPYEVLDLPRDATPAEIKAAKRRASRRAHPDAGGNSEMFHAVQRAAGLLLDDKRRRRYDATGEDEEPRPNQREQEAIEALFTIVTNIIESEGFNPDAVDVIAHAAKAVHDTQARIALEISKTRARMDRLQRTAKRFRRRGSGQNLLAKMIETKAAGLEQMLDGHEAAMQTMRRVGELLSDYDYAVEMMTAMVPTFPVFRTGAAW